MTETSPLGTICKTLARHEAQDADAKARVLNTQGRAVPLVELRLVGDDGEELPRDGVAVGELEARGPWIASAYHDDPDGSREKFRDGWLRTGDVASICPEGYLRIADRTKDLVKSGGEWISSVELEGHIVAHPGVLEAAVVAIPHPRWAERPLACVVARPEAKASLTAAEIIEFIRPRVAKWWLPDDVLFLDALPKTSVGKLDKKVLRERFKDHAAAGGPNA